MSALSDKGITLEGLAAAVDSLRQELATWKALAHKQDQLSADQITATQSGATAAKISQIAVNTAAIQSLAAQVAGQISLEYVTTLPATGEPLTLYLVPQGDGTAPNYCNEYLWVNNDWELIGTTGAMANNGELSIQVNGVAVGTFTANQAANSTVNITVPTNTNQLVNGAGYVDTAALQAALLLKQNNLTAVQLEAVNSGITAAAVQQIADNATAISGKQDALTVAQQAAVDSGATAAKIDQIAANASAIVSLTFSKQDSLSTTQLAAVNSGITASAVQQIGTNASSISSLQTAVASKAADNSVVHLAGAETISGDKTFTGATATHNITPETDGTYSLGSSSYQWSAVYAQTYYYNGTAWGLDKNNEWTGSNTFSGATNCVFSLKFGSSGTYNDIRYYDSNGSVYTCLRGKVNELVLGLRYSSASNWYDGASVTINNTGVVQIKSYDGTESWTVNFAPVGVYPTSNKALELGTSAKKWKSLNGIDPGALSLPSAKSARITVDITNWDKTNYTINSYSAPANGWMAVAGTAEAIQVENNTRSYGSTFTRGADNYCESFLPIGAGDTFYCRIKNGGSNVAVYFYPCLGNV